MPKISEIFGSEKLSYEEFVKKAAEAGGEFGDVAEMRKAHTAEMNRLRVTGAVEREAMRAGAKNSGLLMRVIDMAGVTVDDSGVHGIAEQIGKLRESDPYLFAETAPASASVKEPAAPAAKVSISTGAPHGRETVDPDLLSDADYYAGRMKQ
ncbi:MAG: phage scaffolding protein [Clostridia bacterium]|nr:phage scaffolding protein [Clostridia bacterium]